MLFNVHIRLFMVNIMDHTINEETNTKDVRIIIANTN